MLEVDLYAPVKAFLERQGYVVKAEVRHCDVVGVRGDEPPVVVELKRGFGMDLLLQGVDRLTMTDAVYLAVAAWPKRLAEVRKLCRRVGLGLMIVRGGKVEVLLDPLPYRPRKDNRRTGLLLREHTRRAGDPNRGGSSRVPIVTAYRQEALRCATLIDAHGPMTLPALRTAGPAPNAAKILQRDVYGWFRRVARGTYGLSDTGQTSLARFGRVAPEEPRP